MTKLSPLGLLGCILVFSIICLGAQEPATQILHNNDVVSLSKAGLSDSAVIAVIRKSKTSFDLKPDDLVSLRQQGVSNAVIETMLGLHAPEAATESRQTSSVESSGIALPTQYGYYVIEHGTIRQIYAAPVRTIIGISGRIPPGWAVDGVSGEPTFTLTDPHATFVIYQQNVDVQRARYGPAAFLRSMRAADFDGANVNPQFFAGIYNKNSNDVVPVNLWRPKGAVRFVVEPVVERPGMFKMHPQGPLAPGRYISFFEDLMHMDGTIFVASQTEPVFALFFAVSPTTGAAAPQPTDSTNNVTSSASANCTDYDNCLREGGGAFNSAQFPLAIADFTKASEQNPPAVAPWAWLGKVYLATGHSEEAVAMWDKSLTLGGPLNFHVCYEQRPQFCDRGSFSLSPSEISFTNMNRQKLFAAAPSQVAAQGTFTNSQKKYLSFGIQLEGGAKYNFHFEPPIAACGIQWSVNCPQQGVAQQSVVANYISQAIPKLASGTFNPSTKPAVTTSPVSQQGIRTSPKPRTPTK